MKRPYLQAGVPLLLTVVVVLTAILALTGRPDPPRGDGGDPPHGSAAKAPTVAVRVNAPPTSQLDAMEETAAKATMGPIGSTPKATSPTIATPEARSGPRSFLDALCSDPGAGIHSATDFQLGAPHTVDGLGEIYPHIVIATVRREGPGRCIDEDPLSGSPPSIFTPARLRIEKVLVSKVDVPAGAEYVQYGGRFGKNTLLYSVPNLEPGERYVLFTTPLTDNERGINTRIMKVGWAMRIDEQGRVNENTGGKALPEQNEPGEPPTKKPLAEVIARLRELGASSKWQPMSERHAP